MRLSLVIGVAVLVLAGLAVVDSVGALECCTYDCWGWEGHGWHGSYYNVAWGMPVALVVPPGARAHVGWGWGVGNTRVGPICPQFTRNWPGPADYDPRVFRPTPHWPSDTDQFGIYYVRGPW